MGCCASRKRIVPSSLPTATGWQTSSDPATGNVYFCHTDDPAGTVTWDWPSSCESITLVAGAPTRSKFKANEHSKPFKPPEGCPPGGEYDHTSGHFWANHSGGGRVLRLQCPSAPTRIKEVRATATACDQGWGGTGEAGVCVVLLSADGTELAYSVQSLQGHGNKDLRWTMTPSSHGASFQAKKREAAWGTVCGVGCGHVLEMRAFVPNYAGWCVELLDGSLAVDVEPRDPVVKARKRMVS